MKFIASLLLMICFAAPALADIRPDDVWQNIKQSLERHGTLTANVAARGDDLEVSKLTLKREDGMAITLLTPILLQASDQGRVRIDIAEPWKLQMVTAASAFWAGRIEGDGIRILVSGDPGALNYALDAKTIRLMAAESVYDLGKEGITIDANDPSARVVLKDDRTGEIDGQMSASSYRFDQKIDGPRFTATRHVISLSNFEGAFRARVPLAVLNKDQSLKDSPGAMIDHSAQYEAFTAEDSAYSRNVLRSTTRRTGGTGHLRLVLDQGYLDIEGEAIDTRSPLVINKRPLPGAFVKIDRLSLGARIPFAYAQERRAFDLSVALEGVGPSAGLWAMIDPEEKWPREPANLEMSLNGYGKLAAQLLGHKSIITDDLLDQLTINGFKLGAMGALLSAQGLFDFDHTDIPAGTPPKVDGQLEVTMHGFDDLVDQLQSLGILDGIQTLAIKGARGVFSNEDADGVVTSTIRIAPSGMITANGVPVATSPLR